ncbi:putative nuclease HARBI1, partial [Tanacetum coccineum]
MGDTNLTFTPEQYKFFLESCIEEVNRVKAKGNSLHVESWLIRVEDDVNSFNKEGGSSAASEHVNLDAGYDSSFKYGSSKKPNVARGGRNKKSKKDSELGELEETMKNAITNIAAQENQGPTIDECHEKLKSMRLDYEDPIYLAATEFEYFHEEVIRPTTFNPNPNIPGNNRRERRMFKGTIGALDGTLIHASVPSHKQNVYRARGRGDCYQNVLAICDFNMIFIYIVARWEGMAHDARILNEALDDPIYEFPNSPSDKYYLCDAAYRHTCGFMAPYRIVRYCLGDFHWKHAMTSKEKFNHDHAKLRNVIEHAFGVLKARFPILKSMPKFPLSDIHVNENVRDDNDGDFEVAQPIGSEADQQYMINLRDDIATQIMQARS